MSTVRVAEKSRSIDTRFELTNPIVATAFVALALASSSCDVNFFICDEVDREALLELPTKLSETGLYADIDSRQIAEDVIAYRPQFELWSDGAEKSRWFRLPPQSQIDTDNLDDWQFPIGTVVFKEFASATRPLETRVLKRIGPGVRDWLGIAYVWHPDGTDAIARADGALAVGTLASTPTTVAKHNVPAASECVACHGGRESYVLGLSAISLAYAPGPDATFETLDGLFDRGLLSEPPAQPIEVPGDPIERGALGYLHANCGHCHNTDRPPRVGARCFEPQNDLDFWLRSSDLETVAETGTYRTAIDEVVVRGYPNASELIDRVSKRGFIYQMPPVGTEVVDREAILVLRRWVSQL